MSERVEEFVEEAPIAHVEGVVEEGDSSFPHLSRRWVSFRLFS